MPWISSRSYEHAHSAYPAPTRSEFLIDGGKYSYKSASSWELDSVPPRLDLTSPISVVVVACEDQVRKHNTVRGHGPRDLKRPEDQETLLSIMRVCKLIKFEEQD
ncbi:MAG: hypothetical protein MMC23_006784 [Stictis urceolatum]|nr:hypothetical protein [Stictis urceolata]